MKISLWSSPKILAPLLLLGSVLLGSCASSSFIGAESPENLRQLQRGMSQQQVLNLLGSPDSVIRNGDSDRWIYRFRKAENSGGNAFVEFSAGALLKTGELSPRDIEAAEKAGVSGTCTRWVRPELRMESLCTQ